MPLQEVITRRSIHMIGNAHIDPVWLWHWQEGYQEVRATFSAALDRMDEYPDFVFTMNQIVFLTWIAEHDRPLFERIRERVQEGRWEIVGGMWVEPDCNVPSGESLVRHLLYSQRYLLREFGVQASVGLNADPFGHNASLPAILAGAGIDSYLFLRPQAHEMALPAGAFWWTSPDGSRVLASRIPHEYCTPPGEVTNQVAKSLAQLPTVDTPLLCFYGVGNHGGGPTRANIDSIHQLAARDGFPPLRMTTARAYVDAVVAASDDLPTVHGELQRHAVGCYSAVSEIKRNNRRCEQLLAVAEKWATVAEIVAGTELPDSHEEVQQAWTTLLSNQFHDVLPGTALADTYQDARDQHGLVATMAGRIANRSIQAISRRIGLAFDPDEVPLAVFNPNMFPLRACVETEYNASIGPFELLDDVGAAVDVQTIRSQAVTAGRGRLTFVADLPSLGYRVYRLRRATSGGAHHSCAAADQMVLENENLRAVVDRTTGWLSGLTLTGSPVSLVDPSRPHAVVLADSTDTWSHGIRSYRDVKGQFTPVRVERIESGPVRQTIRVISEYGHSTLVEEIRLSAGSAFLEVCTTIDWHERHALFKLRVPAALTQVSATHEIPYGYLTRPADGDEVPSQRWVDVTGRSAEGSAAGVSLINDGKYSFDVEGGDLGMTAARSPIFAWHDPAEPQDGEPYRYQDQGEQRFTYRVLPHAGDWRHAGVVRAAASLGERPTVMFESAHPGPLPLQHSFARVQSSSDAVMLTVLKRHEEPAEGAADTQRAVVVRGYEAWGAVGIATVDLHFLGRSFDVSFGPHEIKSCLVTADGSIIGTDLLERPLTGLRTVGQKADGDRRQPWGERTGTVVGP